MTGFYEGTGGEATPVPHDLDTHTDATITTPTDGQIIVYEAVSGQWINVDDTAENTPDLALEQLNNVTDTPPTDGALLQWSDASGEWINGASSGTGINLNDVLDVTITTPEENDALVYEGGVWVNKTTTSSISNPIVVGDGADVTDAGVILNSGTTNGTDNSTVTFQHGGVEAFVIDSTTTADPRGAILTIGNVSQYEDGSVIIGDGSASTGNITYDSGAVEGDKTVISYAHAGVTQFTTECELIAGPEYRLTTGAIKQFDDGKVWIESDSVYFGSSGPDTDVYNYFFNGDIGAANITAFGIVGALTVNMNEGRSSEVINFFTSPGNTVTNKTYVDSLYANSVVLDVNQTITSTKTWTQGQSMTSTTGNNVTNVTLNGFVNYTTPLDGSGYSDVVVRDGGSGALGIKSVASFPSAAQLRNVITEVANILNATPAQQTAINNYLTGQGL